jgi:isocitrate/isopropylmalate dehydrogenase
MKIDVVALPGEGIGPEVMAHGLRVLRAVGAATSTDFAIDEIPAGGQYYLKDGQRDWPESSEAKCKAADVILLGAVGWPGPNGAPITMKDGRMAGWSPVIGNRLKLDLYANVRPVKLYPGVKHMVHGKHKQVWEPGQVDMVIIRENTEGLYAGHGGISEVGGKASVATDTRIITRAASEKVIRYAFELSRKRGKGAPKDGKKRVTCILKDNVLRGCQLFGQVFREVGAEYPDIEKDFAIIDAFTQWLVISPENYDVCVTTNMFGDIVTDLASTLQGGMGMAVGCNTGDDHAMFEPIHGTAPKFAGKDKLNPLAMILAVREAIRWVGERKQLPALVAASDKVEQAVLNLLAQGAPLTADLVGEAQGAPMSAVGNAVLAELENLLRA